MQLVRIFGPFPWWYWCRGTYNVALQTAKREKRPYLRVSDLTKEALIFTNDDGLMRAISNVFKIRSILCPFLR